MVLCVVTGTRAEYGILKPLLSRLQECPDITLRLVATGSHMAPQYGNTYKEILEDGFFLDATVPIIPEEGKASTSCLMANTLTRFDAYFWARRPDAVLVLGDRYEIFAVTISAYNQRIPVIHLYGGDTTEGALDEAYRHSITKMSYLHFVSNPQAKKRVIQLGEAPERVFNVGALGVENALNEPLYSVAELEEELHMNLQDGYAVVTFHPVTQESGTAEEQCNALLAALDARDDLTYIITKSNADEGGAEVNALLDTYAQSRSNIYLTPSLGMRRYLSAVSHARMVIGNSSSGIYEVPAFHVPTVNIGDRQRGRLAGKSVLSCKPDTPSILAAMKQAAEPDFLASIQGDFGMYGDGHTSERMLRIIQEQFLNQTPDLKKQFHDL